MARLCSILLCVGPRYSQPAQVCDGLFSSTRKFGRTGGRRGFARLGMLELRRTDQGCVRTYMQMGQIKDVSAVASLWPDSLSPVATH